MKKKIIGGTIILALASSLIFAPSAVQPASAAAFKDTQNHWAKQVVDESYALDLMKGYPGEVFKPEDPVSRLEAIAIIIRGMGLEKDALALDYKKSGVNLPKGMDWGQGFLVLATQKGLLDKNYVSQLMYNNPITRQEVAALVALALHDKLKVKGNPQNLSFSDTAEINLTYLPYVADVVQNNIMQGQGNNEFGPNDLMKRGQMAALMVNTALNGWFNCESDKVISGVINSIDANIGLVVFTKSDGTQLPRLINANTVYYRDGAESSGDQFKPGDKVLAIVGGDAAVRYMQTSTDTGSTDISTGTATQTELTGKITDRSLTGSSALKIRDIGCNDQTYPLSAGVVITDGSNTLDPSSLTDGQFVTADISNNQISKVTLLMPEYTEGKVTGIYSSYYTVDTGSNITKTFSVNPNGTKIIKSDTPVPFTDLSAGDWIKVTSVNGKTLEITVGDNPASSGLTSDVAEVRGVDSLYGFITLLDKNGFRKEYPVEVNALIEKGGGIITLNGLEIGDTVRFKVGSDGNITEIEATGAEVQSKTGIVTDLLTGSSPRIYIDSNRYEVDQNAEVTRDGNDISLNDIMIGSQVTIKMDSNGTVVRIIVQ